MSFINEKFPLRTERLTIDLARPEHARSAVDFHLRNREFLKPWIPERLPKFYTYDGQLALLETWIVSSGQKKELRLFLFKTDQPEKMIGEINYSHLIYGFFRSCFLGYCLDEHACGKGLMQEALAASNRFVFDEYGLHRIEANIIPANIRSKAVVRKLGFHYEGTAIRYVKINGQWQDHEHYALLNE